MSDRTPLVAPMTSVPSARCISADDAVELAELLEFMGHWLGYAPDALGCALDDFCGPGYILTELGVDLTRFARLLNGRGDRSTLEATTETKLHRGGSPLS